MSGLELLRYLTQVPFLVIFVVVCARAVRQPRRTNVDIAFFFGALSLIFAVGWITDALGVELVKVATVSLLILVMALPYILLRLVADFAGAPALYLRAAEAGLALSAVSLWFYESPYPTWYTLALVAYWVTILLYVAVRFSRSALRARGVARRRKQAIALGTLGLALTLFFAGVQAVVPQWEAFWSSVSQVSTLLAGLAYLAGFAPPSVLRRGWQVPEFRAFLARSEALVQASSLRELALQIERGAADTLGADGSALLLWDERRQRLVTPGDPDLEPAPRGSFVDEVYESQAPRVSLDAPVEYPDHAEEHERAGAITILGAPVSTALRRFGVLTAYSERSALFADEDLQLLALVAQQVALQLWSRESIERVAELTAREEATRMKEEFLSAAAHDLKTPLTTLLGQTQLMARRAARDPQQPPDAEGLQRMAREALRMRALIEGLLDASRPGDAGFVTERHPVDIVPLVRELIVDRETPTHSFRVEADGPCVANVDEMRVRQVLQNLLDNAVKYSPHGGRVEVTCACDGEAVQVSVSDEGIGIPEADIPHLFQRFYRGDGANDRKFSGMGLGLYLVERIVGEHGGDVRVSSEPGKGSTFTVRLPVAQEGQR